VRPIDKNAHHLVLRHQGNAEHGAKARESLAFGVGVILVLEDVGDVNGLPPRDDTADRRTLVSLKGMSTKVLQCFFRRTMCGQQMKLILALTVHVALVGTAQTRHRLDQGLEHGLQRDRGAADGPEHVAGRGLLLERLAQFAQQLATFEPENADQAL